MALLPGSGVGIVPAAGHERPAAGVSPSWLQTPSHASAVYVMYTSGSTGTPKGVVVGRAAHSSSSELKP
jgi:long-subunit acyl-CoA synthetase (AMP-forming)